MAKDVGAKKVIVASCAPPIRYSNCYGIDMPSRAELVAFNKDTPSIADAIGADLVIFQTLPDLIHSVRQFNPSITNFDCSVFTGEYVTGGVNEQYLEHIEKLRNDNVRAKYKGSLDGESDTDGGKSLNGLENSASEAVVSASSPMNGGRDDTVGLHNGWRLH